MWLRKWIATLLITAALCACASGAQLVWDANTEDDLAGYKIHYDAVHGPPYSYTIDVGNVTAWQIPDEWPRDREYFFRATAYNSAGYESLYSNEAVFAQVGPEGPARATNVRIVFQPTVPEPPMSIDLTLEYASIGRDYRTNTTINKPANTADGDFLLCGLYITKDTAVTPPSGWTLIAEIYHSEADRGNLFIYYKRASSEGASWTWTHAYSVSVGIVKRITGVISSGDPEDVSESTVESGYATGTITNASITTATNGSAVIQIVGLDAAGRTITSSTLTKRASENTGAYSSEFVILGDVQATAGATGNKSATRSDYTRAIGILIALKPAATVAAVSIPPRILQSLKPYRHLLVR